ncbi:MAG TPA: 4-hydroxybenzoate 3-monooxygenase, partial [Roseiflexaceae bacterium]|nr:4-hydroxybenzoate 3-monooxygenase [Roseiflexaceae bacterium]
MMRTQVAIIGAGPAGLMLSHLLHLHGIESVVLESRDRAYVEKRQRAGVLEQPTVDLLRASGVGERLDREGLIHHGLFLQFAGSRHRIDMSDLTDGRAITVYGQHEVVKDLIAARLAAGGRIFFEVQNVALHDVTGMQPRVLFRQHGEAHELTCDVIAGCDGSHGVSRRSIPDGMLTIYQRTYPIGWLGILAAVAPSTHELIYAHHARGFALHSMRSTSLSRLYVQCDPADDLANWPDERIWAELHARLETADGWKLEEGPILERGITGMRSYVVSPMQYGRLFLAGDVAHVVPATGAKGMNLAIADVRVLADALSAWYETGSTRLLDAYS